MIYKHTFKKYKGKELGNEKQNMAYTCFAVADIEYLFSNI